METSYYLIYNSGAGIIGFTGGNTPFLFTEPAVKFPSRKLARQAMNLIKAKYRFTFTRQGWSRFRIIESTDGIASVIKNKE